SVARVGDVDIKRATFDHWALIAARQQAGSTGGAVVTPKPPDFKNCIAAKKATAPAPAKGQPKPTDDEYKTQCKTEFDAVRDTVVSLLVNAEWIFGEAHDRGVKLSD